MSSPIAKLIALGTPPELHREVSHPSFFPTVGVLTATRTDQQTLHERAAAARAETFGNQVFVRGVVEVSNYCRENCRYCGMRRDNRGLKRFRADANQLAEWLLRILPSSVTDINIQSGEDPLVVTRVVVPLIEMLRRETSVGVSVCLGTLNHRLYSELRKAGAEIYILKFEVGNPARFEQLEAPGTWQERIDHIRLLASAGWKVSSGFIAGLPGENPENLLENFAVAGSLPLDGCSVSPFIAGEETPLRGALSAGIDLTLNCMAALRLMRRDWIIPAVSALNLAEPSAGYRRGLRAGANLVTINLTPDAFRDDYLLYKRDRFIMTEERILDAICRENLTASRQSLAAFYRGKSGALSAARLEAAPV